MRIAITLSGELRNYENFIDWIDDFAFGLKADLFVHGWDCRVAADQRTKISTEELQSISNRLRPIAIDLEDFSVVKKEFEQFAHWDSKKEHWHSKSAENFAAMYYSIYASNYLRRQWETASMQRYDLIFRHRWDFKFLAPLSVEELDLEAVNVLPINRDDGTCDIWAAGNSRNINIYSDVMNNFDEAMENSRYVRPEDMLKYWLDKNQVKINVIDKKYQIK